MISTRTIGSGVSQVTPINLGIQLLAENTSINRSLNNWTPLGGNSAINNPLLDTLVTHPIKALARVAIRKKLSRLYRPAKNLNRVGNVVSCFHRRNTTQEKLVMQAQQLDFLAMTPPGDFHRVGSMGETIHDRVRTLRAAMGSSMQDVAAAVGAKAYQTVQQWEDKKSAPSRKRVPLLATFFGVTVEYLETGACSSPGKAILAGMQHTGISTSELAAHLGVAEIEIYRWISGGRAIRQELLSRLASKLQMMVEEFDESLPGPYAALPPHAQSIKDAIDSTKPGGMAPPERVAEAIAALLEMTGYHPQILGTKDNLADKLMGKFSPSSNEIADIHDGIIAALSSMSVSGADPRKRPETFAKLVTDGIAHKRDTPSSEEVQHSDANPVAVPRKPSGHTHLGNAPRTRWSANEKKAANGTEGGTGGTT